MTFRNIPQRWKLCIALSSILVLSATGTGVQACYDYEDPDEIRYMLFNPDLLENKSWWSFFYSANINAYHGKFSSASDEDILTAEWIAKLGGKADTTAARNCLFSSLQDTLLESNSFYRQLKKKPALFRYFQLARSSERLASIESSWEEKSVDDSLNDATVQEAMTQLHKENDPFLKKKYAFQLVKLGFYSTDRMLFDSIYANYFENVKNRGVLDWWAVHYKSMKYDWSGKHDSANYLHSLVFSHTSAKMMVSQQNYAARNFDSVRMLARNDAERADMYVMRECINPGRALNGITKVYKLAPHHPHLPLLISREINKFEDWLGTTRYLNRTASTRTVDYGNARPALQYVESDLRYLQEFIRALESMDGFAAVYPDYYNLALANLKLLYGDGTGAARYLARVKDNNPAVAYQADVLRIVLATMQNDIRNQSVQNTIGRLYQSLLARRNGKFESEKILFSLSTYLRYTFAKKGLVGLAGLFDNYAVNKFCFTCTISFSFEYSMISYLDRYASAEDLEWLIKRFNSTDKNNLEEVLMKPYANQYYIYDLLATKYLRQGDVKNALATLKKIPDDFWPTFYNAMVNLDKDPFTVNDALLSPSTMTTYTKREIVERLYALETEATTDTTRRAANYFLLGNAWYNFTEHSWFMLSYSWSTLDTEDPVYRIGHHKARACYSMALMYEENPEQRAKILYMLATLAQNKQKQVEYARAYEKYESTAFYSRRNCMTTRDMK